MPFSYDSLEDRLHANTRKTPKGCWEWTGKRNNYGYGILTRRDPRMPARMLTLPVHRVAYLEVAGRTLKPGHEVSHKCHNPACWNPAHLIGETHRQNMRRG